MSRVLIIGCGGGASVAIQKCCQNDAVFTEICIASRTVSKCDALKAKIEAEGKSKRQAKIAGLNKFLRIYYARVSEVYKAL